MEFLTRETGEKSEKGATWPNQSLAARFSRKSSTSRARLVLDTIYSSHLWDRYRVGGWLNQRAGRQLLIQHCQFAIVPLKDFSQDSNRSFPLG